MQVTSRLLDYQPCTRAKPIVPYERFMKFLEIIAKRGKELHRESQNYQANLQVEMTESGVQMANLMLNVFTCVEEKFAELVYMKPLQLLPIQAFFIKEMNEFDESLKNMDRLGGTLGHIETENAFLFASNKVPGKLRISEEQRAMLQLFKLIIQMFNCGLLDHIRNF